MGINCSVFYLNNTNCGQHSPLSEKQARFTDFQAVGSIASTVIIPGLSEPPVRTLRATIPENESHIFR